MKMEEFMISLYERTKSPYKAIIELTRNCNLRCKHCYIPEHAGMITKKDVYKLADVLESEGYIWIILTGGEVFSHPHFCDIYFYMKQKGFIIDIKTNALLLTDKIKDILVKYPPRKLDISVYGLCNKKYGEFTGDYQGFFKLKSSLDWLYENDFSFQLTVMAIRENFQELASGKYDDFFERYNCNIEFEYDIINNLDRKRGSIVSLLEPSEIVELESNSKLYIREIKQSINEMKNTDFVCQGGKKSVYIDADMEVHICVLDNVKFPLEELLHKDGKLFLRSKEIEKKFCDSMCYMCAERLGCKRCPVKHELTERKDSNLWRCEIAQRRYKEYQNFSKKDCEKNVLLFED